MSDTKPRQTRTAISRPPRHRLNCRAGRPFRLRGQIDSPIPHDNVFVERFWSTVKYEEVYLRAYGTVSEARVTLRRYVEFYNARRAHRALDGRSPDEAYFVSPDLKLMA